MESLHIETMNHGQEKLSHPPQNINFEDMLSKQDFEFKTKSKFQESLEQFSLKKIGIFFSVIIILFIFIKSMNNSISNESLQFGEILATKEQSDSILRLSEKHNSNPHEVQETLDTMSVFATDGSTYPQVWLALKNKVSQFIIFTRSSEDSSKVEAQFGPWGADFSNFTSLIRDGQQQVGFVYIGNSSGVQLYLVVYVPSQTSLTPAQVLINFGLPTDAASLTSFGIQTPLIFVMTELSQLTSSNIISQATSSSVTSLL